MCEREREAQTNGQGGKSALGSTTEQTKMQNADVPVRRRERCEVSKDFGGCRRRCCRLLTREAVWEMENIVTWVTRISSHPFRAKQEPQALPGVFTCAPGCSCISWGSVGEGMEWHVEGWMEIQFRAHTGPKIPTFRVKKTWARSQMLLCTQLCVPAVVWFHGFNEHRFDQTLWASTSAKESYSSNESYFLLSYKCRCLWASSVQSSWNMQGNPRLDQDRIHWCGFRMDGTLKLMNLYEKSALTENLPQPG